VPGLTPPVESEKNTTYQFAVETGSFYVTELNLSIIPTFPPEFGNRHRLTLYFHILFKKPGDTRN
jgi:hypothetical protein